MAAKLNFLGCLVPICFIVFYYVNPDDVKCDATMDANYAINSNPNKTGPVKYLTLKPFGSGKRDAFIMFFGYLIEMALTALSYNLLWNVVLLHKTFNDYLISL